MMVPLGESFVDRDSFLPGKRSAEDRSYQALGLSRGCSRIEREGM